VKAVCLVNCSQLVTLSGPSRSRVRSEMSDLAILTGGALRIEDGVIRQVGPSAQVDTGEAEVIDCTGKVVLPGWVDAHTHPVFGGDRVDEFEMRSAGAGYEEIAAAGGGIRSTVAKTRAATEDELFAGAKRRLTWFLRNGTTTIEAKSGYGLSTGQELKMLRVIRRLGKEGSLTVVPTFLGAHAFPSNLERDEYVAEIMGEMLPQVASEGLAKWCDIFVERNYFTVEQARRILGEAKRLGLGLRMHVDQLTDGGGAALAAELGAKTADHLEQTGAEGFAMLRASGVIPVLLPGSVYALGLSKYPDARGMIDSGLPVVLASDFNPGSSPIPSMPMILSLACTRMRMTPAEAITAGTINAAHSLDLGHDRGSIEAGKVADLVVYGCSDYREIPYWCGAPLVSEVIKSGVPLRFS